MSYAGLSPPHAVKRRVQFYETLMPRNPFPRFRRGPEATHCGRISTGYDDLNAERPIFQRNGTIGCPGVRVCHSHALYMAWRVPIGNPASRSLSSANAPLRETMR